MSMINIGGSTSKSMLTAVKDGDVQPNAVDLRLKRVFKINDQVFLIDEENKVHRGATEVFPTDDGYWHLTPGDYEIEMDNIINVAEGESGFVITRSTLNRNGVFITSGLYDSGYHGPMSACMHVGVGVMMIKPGTRVAQYLSFEAESLHAYDGDYGFDIDGAHKHMEKMYRNMYEDRPQ